MEKNKSIIHGRPETPFHIEVKEAELNDLLNRSEMPVQAQFALF
jgi:hypothetical protein